MGVSLDAVAERLHTALDQSAGAAVTGNSELEHTLIEVFTGLTGVQLQRLQGLYEARYGSPLGSAVTSATFGNFERLLLLLLEDRVEVDVKALYAAMKGLGTDDNVVIEVISTRAPTHIRAVAELYNETYKRPLHDDIESDTSGDYRHMLLMLLESACEGTTNDSYDDAVQAVEDARRIYEASEGQWGTNETELIEILAHRGAPHIESIVRAYQQLGPGGLHLKEALRSDTSGDLQTLLVAIVSPGEFLATRLRSTMKGMGTDEEVLSRLLTCTAERHLKAARVAYRELYGRSLIRDIYDETSGPYRQLLSMLLLREPGDRRVFLLHQAMEGLGVNEEMLSAVLTGCTTKAELRRVAADYKKEFGRKLENDIASETSGHLKSFLLQLFSTRSTLQRLHGAMYGIGTREGILVEILTCRTPYEIRVLARDYEREYNIPLREHVESEVSGDFGRLLMRLLGDDEAPVRDTPEPGDEPLTPLSDGHIAALAIKLYEAGEGRMGTAEDTFVDVFTSRSPEQLLAISTEYQRRYGHDLGVAVAAETSGDLEMGLSACMYPERLAATMLYRACRGPGTDDETLIYMLGSREHDQLQRLQRVFKSVYDEDLTEFVCSELSGSFRQAVAAHLGHRDDLSARWRMALRVDG